jgi:hypothetical protein
MTMLLLWKPEETRTRIPAILIAMQWNDYVVTDLRIKQFAGPPFLSNESLTDC